MSAIDKAKNKAEELIGKAKEAVGGASGNKDLKHEGQGDQAKGNVKQGGENVKDAASDTKDKLTGD
ncbi:CsbD family protein [Rhodococcus sp. X156]|uniref:CsbD family protein n=1 Tax=Rhodococcus sp. X156 TaxID=2499145 RepID=UPI000FD93FB6|nr:CsbD family protein [Rhodococcus sp. X156]